MEIILDSDVIVRGEKGVFDLAEWTASRPDDPFEIAAITAAELWHGVRRALRPHNAGRRRYLETVLELLPIVPYTQQTALEHARIWAELEASCLTEELFAWITAYGQSGAVIWTW